MTPRRAVVLVDGEHYPPVIRAALQSLAEQGTTAVAALFLGGTEKVVERGTDVDLGVPAEWVASSGGPAPDIAVAGADLTRLVAEHRPDVVVDLSDEPVLDARHRLQLASHVLLAGVTYEGADFVLTPPARPRLTRRPTIAVIGTGKRTGKTAVAGEMARCLRAGGREPVIVAMGRGGPSEPVIVRAGARLDPETLLAVADAGGHAASDFYEDAVTSGAATVGARRCGGGLAGAVGYSNVAAAVRAAESLPGDLLLVEGSGSAVPPVHADATVLVVPADCDPELVRGYLGSYRVLLADLIVVTMCESPRGVPKKVDAVTEALRSISRRSPVLRTVLRPVPLEPVGGDRVFFATTAPATVGASLVDALEERHGCEVVATSHRLADRPALISDLAAAPPFDLLLVELKAAAIDVAVRSAARAGARVVFCDNRPIIVGANEATGDATGLQDAVVALTRLADERATAR
jgi:cyclic 2,3-diphosphoglycerate synthetase